MRECNAKVMPQKITLTLRPVAAFEMPYSEGYQLYSALLRVMGEADSAMAKHTHDSPISSISLGPLEGRFRRSERAMHKAVDVGERYDLAVGITDQMKNTFPLRTKILNLKSLRACRQRDC